MDSRSPYPRPSDSHNTSQSTSSSHAPYIPTSKQPPLHVPFSDNYRNPAPDPFLPNPQSQPRRNSHGLNNGGRDIGHISRDSGGSAWSSTSGMYNDYFCLRIDFESGLHVTPFITQKFSLFLVFRFTVDDRVYTYYTASTLRCFSVAGLDLEPPLVFNVPY
jgi:hypothetical protein